MSFSMSHISALFHWHFPEN